MAGQMLFQIVGDSADGDASTPALPLFAFTRRNASFRFTSSHTSSINRNVLAGLSGSCIVETDTVSSLPASVRASLADVEEKFSSGLNILLRFALETHHVLLAAPLVPGLQPSFPARPIC